MQCLKNEYGLVEDHFKCVLWLQSLAATDDKGSIYLQADFANQDLDAEKAQGDKRQSHEMSHRKRWIPQISVSIQGT